MLHVDIMDAHFVPNLSYGPALVKALRGAFPAVFQGMHLMMTNPENYLDPFIKAGRTASPSMPRLRAMWLGILEGISARAAAKPGYLLSSARRWSRFLTSLPLCDLVLLMTVEPGFGGQKIKTEAKKYPAHAGVYRRDLG